MIYELFLKWHDQQLIKFLLITTTQNDKIWKHLQSLTLQKNIILVKGIDHILHYIPELFFI